MNNTTSDSTPLIHGVPQGSILGPILFSLYTKEISNIAQSFNINVHVYADDTQLYMKCDENTDFTIMEKCIQSISNWSNNNFLKLNSRKTKILAVSSQKYSLDKITHLNILGDTIQVDSSVRNLGFILDEYLTMGQHINRVCSLGYGMLRNLWKISKKVTDQDLRTQLVHSGILSRINYCNSLYTFIPGTQTKKLQKLMNASARFIFNIKGKERFEHITPRLRQLHFLPVNYRSDFKLCLMVYKCLNDGNSPTYLTELVNIRKPNKNWNLRKDEDTTLLDYRPSVKGYKSRSFSQAAPILWNQLPKQLRASQSTDIFKSNLKTYLFKKWAIDSNLS